MIRLAIVIEALGRGGAERLLVDTVRLIDRSRFDLRVFTLFAARRDYAETLRSLGVAERCLGLSGPWQAGAGVRRLASVLRQEPADLIHTHLYTANLVGRVVGWLQGIPVVSSYHGVDYEPIARASNRQLTRTKQYLLLLVDRLARRASDAYAVAVSEYVAASISARLGFPPQRISIIPNAVDTSVFFPDATAGLSTRRSLGLGPDEQVVLCVGRMTPEKAQHVLIRAFGACRCRRRRLLLVGDGVLRPELEALARDVSGANHVVFLGSRTDVPDLLRAADVLVLPSLHEGFGLVVAEALSSGTPVVASRVGPLPEIVREGETGLLVRPGDSRALAEALESLLEDPDRRRQMGRRGREDACSRFALRRMVGQLEGLYDRLARR